MASGLWVYLATSPLLWLSSTLVMWTVAVRLASVQPNNPVLNPAFVSITAIAAALYFTGIDYDRYFAGAQFIHFLLGPATVALGIPLFEKLSLVKENLLPLVISLVIGSVTAIGSTIFLGRLFGFPHQLLASVAPKSATTAVAMAIADSLHGDPALTAAVVIATGICGAIIVTPLMNAMRIRDYSARGFAVGLASHGIGTARAYSVDPIAGLFSGLAMGLNAVVTSIVVRLFF
ncbi:LrgB family protein [Rhizobium sp. BK060]|uniref:LrgB family protein n=1 Tax=Rhizobium sp. BK060 TaxID=2587096 RepID=UPI001622388B|nr:LrgB family protein [Rhizobium sp. BK060]MBB3396059.1 putative murein hydrolase (TIGR00659 family) [Rhizobium sp. BK060]